MEKGNLSNEFPLYMYECMNCGYRVEAARRPMECAKCEGEMLNITNPRE